MIALVVEQACIGCGACVEVCPTNVFDRRVDGKPLIARLPDCQTCFLCELYCSVDALYVDPDCEIAGAVDADQILTSGLLGRYRRDSGWGEWSDDPRYANEHWRMDEIFARARAMPPAR